LSEAANRPIAGSPSRVLLRRGRSRRRRLCWRSLFLHRVVVMVPHVMMVMNVHVHVMMVLVAPVVVPRRHRLFRRIGDRLHGHLGDRRSPYERRNCERRNGNAWKLHVVSLVR
jgi:hypothetical protein